MRQKLYGRHHSVQYGLKEKETHKCLDIRKNGYILHSVQERARKRGLSASQIALLNLFMQRM